MPLLQKVLSSFFGLIISRGGKSVNPDYRVAVVSGTALFRKAFTHLLANEFAVLFSVENSQEVKAQLNTDYLPDFILIDIDRNLEDSINTCNWLSKNHPTIKVVAVTIHSEREPVDKMIENGAKGFFLKSILLPEINYAFQSIIKKGMCLHMPLKDLYKTKIPDEHLRNFARDHGFKLD